MVPATDLIDQLETDLRRVVRITEPIERLKQLGPLLESLGRFDIHGESARILAEFGLQSIWVLSTLEVSIGDKSRDLALFLTVLDEQVVLYTQIAERFAKHLNTSDLPAKWPCLFMPLENKAL